MPNDDLCICYSLIMKSKAVEIYHVPHFNKYRMPPNNDLFGLSFFIYSMLITENHNSKYK